MKRKAGFKLALNSLLRLLERKPLNFFFSKFPDLLADDLLQEWGQTQLPSALECLKNYHTPLCCLLAAEIRNRKQNNQLLLIQSPAQPLTRTQEIVEQLKVAYPKAFIKKQKRKARGAAVQAKIDFTEYTHSIASNT